MDGGRDFARDAITSIWLEVRHGRLGFSARGCWSCCRIVVLSRSTGILVSFRDISLPDGLFDNGDRGS